MSKFLLMTPQASSTNAAQPDDTPNQKKRRTPQIRDQFRTPNHAIKCVRKAMGLRQAALGKLLGLTQSYVANIETGRFPTTMNFAVRLAGKSGADVSSIVNGVQVPLDSEGHPYSEVSYLAFQEARIETLSQDERGKSILPIEVAMHAAAGIGRRKVFTNILNATLLETIRAVDGLEQAIENRLNEARRLVEEKSQTRSYTYGELREDTAWARSLGFVDEVERDSGDVAFEVRVVRAENFTSSKMEKHLSEEGRFLLESWSENKKIRWSALFGGNSAMTEKDIDYLTSLIKSKKKSSLP
jgi:transcriptional regulator with XRE-family HTH domain